MSERIMTSGDIGVRIRTYRKRKGMPQATLAGLVGRSESWLSQVERGIRSVDRMSVLMDLARVLDVTPDDLIGQRSMSLAPNGGLKVAILDEVRDYYTAHDDLLMADVEDTGVVDLDALRRDVAAAHTRYQAAQYEGVLSSIVPLLTRVDHAATDPANLADREFLLGYVSAHVVTAKLLTKLGAGDIAHIAADRAARRAIESHSTAARALSAYQVVCALLRQDQADKGEHLSVAMAEQLMPRTSSDEPLIVSATGALWLIAAVIAARRQDRSAAYERLATADRLARLLGYDANFGFTAFGPTNVAIHRVSVEVELGSPGDALAIAAPIDLEALPVGLISRRAQVNLDLAWAQAQRKRDAEATLHLLEAERVSSEVIRHNVVAREVMRDMLSRGDGKAHLKPLQDLAVRTGVLQ